MQAKADAVRAKAQFKAEAIRAKAEEKARHKLAKAENRALKIEGIAPAEVERKIRLDVHGRPKPLMRGWIHAIAAPLSLAAGIVLICLAHGASLKWACAVFMTASLILFTNSACYHLAIGARASPMCCGVSIMSTSSCSLPARIPRFRLRWNRSGAM